MIYCAGNTEFFSFAKPIGVGLVNSAIGLTSSIYKDNPSEIIFVGTCGCYDSSRNLLEVFESQSASNIELSFLQQQSYTPLDNLITLENVSHETLLKSQQINIVNSSNYISTDSSIAKSLLKLGILYENMEFFSILQIAKHFNLPALGIFCSTNHIHQESRKEFLANQESAIKILKAHLSEKK